ncbi:type II toxin-antitoxin system VapC family toxin [Solihabitans fulvus]|uniref:Ribonuclease VapC n=1 Tax=Solihabitans fulvus TaxID=1892852 RepID=A0A5B2XCB8_9PSEU|nr:type II toxin-antitoxin system VapC family toxin [Solihabitans fulvus]KAA2261247.1 type II toxin-antitoxin system VapC family toxin [Solihabitans fulvus]
MIYLDSCAMVKLIVTEKETQALVRCLSGREQAIVTCELALTEVVRVARRSCYDAQRQLTVDPAVLDDRLAAAGELLDRVDRIIVDTTTFLRAGIHADDPHLGSLDAIHLVCALEIGPELSSFITYDRTLARAATYAGLPLEQPA